MKHYSYDEWMQYVKNEIKDNIREDLENHLYTCDHCLEHYLQAVAENETSLPILSNESSLTELVMAEVTNQKNVVPDTESNINIVPSDPLVPDTKPDVRKANNKKKSFYQQAVFHYLLAAVATLILTFSGAFQSLATYAKSIESPHVQEKKPSLTEGMINKTFAWMDSLEKKEANKK